MMDTLLYFPSFLQKPLVRAKDPKAIKAPLVPWSFLKTLQET